MDGRIVSVAIVAVLLVGGEARAEKDLGSVGALLETCREARKSDNKSWYKVGICTGRVEGYMRAYGNYSANPVICLPDNVTLGQMVAIVTKWAEENPDTWHLEYPNAIVGSLSKAFPCQKK